MMRSAGIVVVLNAIKHRIDRLLMSAGLCSLPQDMSLRSQFASVLCCMGDPAARSLVVARLLVLVYRSMLTRKHHILTDI
jgi:hypothetical protein